MAYFKVCVRKKRADNTYPIYIRVTHKRKIGYIKTDKICKGKFVRNGEITDPYIIKDTYIAINGYIDKLNAVNSEDWSVSKVIDYLKSVNEAPSFSNYAREFIEDKKKHGHAGYKNYKLALSSLKKFIGKDDILFSDITSRIVLDWIYSMWESKRKKNSYPRYIKTLFKRGCEMYNDYESGVMVIKNDPFKNVEIPNGDVPVKRALSRDVIRKFFDTDLASKIAFRGNSKVNFTQPYVAKDVCMLVFCLVGINTIDLYKLEKGCYKDGKLCYNRSKTKDRRHDGAYIEITVPDIIKPLISKYAGKERLFNFHEHYFSADCFNRSVNMGVRKICEQFDLEYISTYSFRHSWATIANNVFDIGIDTVGFCLNHKPVSRITWSYIKVDFSKIDRINAKVIDYIFGEKEEKKDKDSLLI